MDIAVNLVESYLRLSGYLTLSEFEVQRRAETGEEDHRMLLLQDPVLELEPEMTDVIIGEVKQGAAEFNPGIRRHVVLHSMLRRVGWLYDEPMADVVTSLQEDLLRISPARGGGSIRTRLVAFGRSPYSDLHTISHTHIVETMLGFFEGTGDAFKPVQFRDPAPAMLSLLLKTGFEVTKDG